MLLTTHYASSSSSMIMQQRNEYQGHINSGVGEPVNNRDGDRSPTWIVPSTTGGHPYEQSPRTPGNVNSQWNVPSPGGFFSPQNMNNHYPQAIPSSPLPLNLNGSTNYDNSMGNMGDQQQQHAMVEGFVKRHRDDDEEETNARSELSRARRTEPPSAPKRTRSNVYIPVRQIRRTFTSQVGSLAVSSISTNADSLRTATTAMADPPRHVGLRRQLSSSKIECFLGDGADSMEVETEATRPRSMSF